MLAASHVSLSFVNATLSRFPASRSASARPAPNALQRFSFVNCDVVRLVALYQILRLVLRGVMHVPLVANVRHNLLDDRAANPSRFRVPFNVIPAFERLRHASPTILDQASRIIQASKPPGDGESLNGPRTPRRSNEEVARSDLTSRPPATATEQSRLTCQSRFVLRRVIRLMYHRTYLGGQKRVTDRRQAQWLSE